MPISKRTAHDTGLIASLICQYFTPIRVTTQNDALSFALAALFHVESRLCSNIDKRRVRARARAQLTARVDYNNGFLDGVRADFDA